MASEELTKGLNSTYWNLVFQEVYFTELKPCELFELHLLESGISGKSLTTTEPPVALFELHLLESGISGLGFKERLG